MSDDAKVRMGEVVRDEWVERGTLFVYDSSDDPITQPAVWQRVAVIPLLPDGSFPPEVVERVARAIHKAIVMRDYGRSDWDHVLGTAALAALTESQT